MEKSQKIIKALAIFSFLLVLANCAFAFADSASTEFIQVMLIAVIAAIVIVAIFIAKDAKASLSVIGAAILYVANLAIRGFIYAFNSIVNFFNQLALNGINESIKFDELSEIEKANKNEALAEVNKRIAFNTFEEIMDIVCIFVAIAVAVFAIMSIISIIKNKKFSKTLIGKFTSKLIETKSEAAKKAENKVADETETVETADETESVVEDEAAIADDKSQADNI